MASKRRGKTEPTRALAPVVPLAARAPMGRQLFSAAPRYRTRTRVAGLTPEQLSAALDRARLGDLEQWADIVEVMLTQDSHIRSVTDTLLRSIAGSELRFTAPDNATDPALAQAGADFCARSLYEHSSRLELTLSNVLYAALVGISIAEHQWEREGREVHSVAQHWVLTRDIRVDDSWIPRVRTYPRVDGFQQGWDWLSLEDEPARWLVHVHTAPGLQSNVAGLLMSCAWPWLWKRWATVFQQDALERFGTPFIYGTLSPNAPDAARDAFFEGLQALSSSHTAVIEQEQAINIVESTSNPGQTYGDAIDRFNAEISKAILGSTLNVEVGDTGGNRALGESQNETTILPRLRAIAASAETAIRATWLQPLLAFNAASFGGRVPPTPHVEFVLATETPPVITQLHVDAGVVRANELRLSAGLDPLDGPEGERFVQPLAKTQAPSFFSDDDATTDERVELADEDGFVAPKGAREEAQRGLDWRREYGRGGTEVGIARARDIARGARLSADTMRRMKSFFARHESTSKGGEGFSPGEPGYPSNGRIAWALWGGDAGKRWAETIVERLDRRETSRVEGGDAGLPLAPAPKRGRPHQLTMAWQTSPTSSPSMTQLEGLLFDASDDPER